MRKPVAFLSLVICLILSGFAGNAFGLNRPLYIAHRGAQLEADENTIKAFQIAVDDGMDYIETDPRLTKDGYFVVMHDPTVDRMTNGKGEVSRMTLAEIKSLRTKNGEQIPTLEEIFNFARGKKIGVYLDTKEKDLSAVQKMIDLVIKADLTGQVIVGLWQMDHLKWIETNHPEVVTCISWPSPPASLQQLKNLNADWVGTLVPLATKAMIEKAHQQGLKVITLEINDPKTIEQKISAGIDAILTDDPKLLAGRK